jgi:predicted dinucleotide-binding enzyme
MNIGIIGAGNIGGTLTRRLRALGHAVAVANSRGPESLAALAAETGATAVSVAEAAHDKNLVIVYDSREGHPQIARRSVRGRGRERRRRYWQLLSAPA